MRAVAGALPVVEDHLAVAAERVEDVRGAAVDVDDHQVALVIAVVARLRVGRDRHVEIGVLVVCGGDDDVCS